jgi:vacuolar-type H+-ATPase subunit H
MARHDPQHLDDVSHAMEEVLGAERQAREAIEAGRVQAGAIVEGAREAVRRIEARTDARISSAHRLCAERTAAAVEAIMATLNAESAEAVQWDDALIAEAVAALATRMTGGDGGADT